MMDGGGDIHMGMALCLLGSVRGKEGIEQVNYSRFIDNDTHVEYG